MRSLVVLLLIGAAVGPVRAQEAGGTAPGDRAAWADARLASQERHLWRVLAWGTLNAVGGAALVLSLSREDHPAGWGFGLQSGAWGVINVGIATAGLLGQGATSAETWRDAVAAERTYHDILLFNMGLNVAYAGVGTAMVVAGYRDVRSARSWRGHGTALILQGVGLLVLDGISLVASRSRLVDLLRVPGDIAAFAAPGGIGLSVHF
jgi:hypothetical protein